MKVKIAPLIILVSGVFSLVEIIPNSVLLVNFFLFLFMIYQNIIKKISPVKYLFLLVTIILLWLKFHSLRNIEFATSLIFTLALLKGLELKSYRDYFNMLLIFILLEGCILIINPSPFFLILSFLKIILFFYLLLKIKGYELEMLNLKRILIISIPAIFFSVALYLFFPRYTQGFLSLNSIDNLTNQSNKSINFENLSELKLSDKKLFTVSTTSNEDLSNQYWRINFLSTFRNKEWRASIKFNVNQPTILQGPNFDYTIKTAGTLWDYLPTLDGKTNELVSSENVRKNNDGTFEIWPPTTKAMMAKFKVYNQNNGPIYDDNIIFKSQNPLDKKIYNELLPYLNQYPKLEAVNKYFKSKKFEYSLNGDRSKSVQEFILSNKKGYCSHFASIYAYLLNLVNIKSRVVIGFQGGIINPFDQSIVIREKDSHAWVEYQNDKTWVRLDPTELVTSNRLLENDLFLNNSKNKYFLKLSFFLDYAEGLLTSNFFTIDNGFQKKYFNNRTTLYLATSFIVFFLILYYIVRITFLLENVEPHIARYNSFKKSFQNKGMPKNEYETALEYMERLIIAFPDERNKIEEETKKYILKSYKP